MTGPHALWNLGCLVLKGLLDYSLREAFPNRLLENQAVIRTLRISRQ